MLTTFFKTSKPIHYIICFMMVGLLVGYFIITDSYLGWPMVWMPFIAMASIAVFQFITLKNELTQSNSYALWTYSCLLIIATLYCTDVSNFVAFLFILLAVRRLISMHTGRDFVKKIFDASFWIAIATLFDSWSILFFIIVFISIILYAFKNFKFWSIPFIAVLCVAILTYTLDLFLETDYLFNTWKKFSSYTDYASLEISLSLIICSLLVVLGLLFSMAMLLLGFPNISLSARSRFSLLSFVGFCAAMVFGINGVAIFVIPVIVVFLSRFIQETDNKIIKETLLWLPFTAMVILFFFKF